jgi:hypothetical protein
MNDKTIIEAVWKKAMAEFEGGFSGLVQPISAELVERIKDMPAAPYGKLRCVNIGTLTPMDIEELTFADIVFYAPDGVKEGGVYPSLSVGLLLTWNWDNAQPVKEDSEDYSYELRSEAFARGGMQAVNDMSYSHDFDDCDMCGGHGCDRCDPW